MKRHIKKLLSYKKTIVLLSILFLIALSIAIYTLIGINQNVQKMAAAKEAPLYFPDYPVSNTVGKDPQVIKRGEYLAKAGDCIACHTNSPEKGQAFAGGLPMQTPFGTIYSPNITPDKETGIGNWTDAQFIKAMREGISPQGHYYYPAFPYYYFNKVTTEDLLAIKGYLESIPPIHQVNRPSEMVGPFNRRFLQLGWRMLFFAPEATGPDHPNPKQSDLWNRGEYLVESLGHCAMCHSPSYHLISENLSLGAPMRKYDLTGAKIQGFLAPNISKSNLAKISEEDVIKVFTEDRMIGGGSIQGPMLEVNHNSLKYLEHSDLLAIATYLKTVDSLSPPIKGGVGKGTYETYCSGCHASGAGGAPKYGDADAWNVLLKGGIEKIYTNAIQGVGGMPAKGTCLSCSDMDIKQAVDYMVVAVSGGAGKVGVSHPKPKPLTMADGKRVYDENCSICHDAGFKGAPKPGDMPTWEPIINAGFIETYKNVVTGRKGHPVHGACPDCSGRELVAAVKYMMQKSTTRKDYNLW